jgi:hypothetical protein
MNELNSVNEHLQAKPYHGIYIPFNSNRENVQIFALSFMKFFWMQTF